MVFEDLKVVENLMLRQGATIARLAFGRNKALALPLS
jgi:hypothetical protein